MRITLDPSAYSSKFHNIIHSWDRYIIAYGGRGSGKTDSFYLKYLLELFEPYYFRLAYINKERTNIKDQQYAGFKRVAQRIGVYDQLRFYDGTYHIVNPMNGNALIPKGMDDPEKTKGLDDITAIWWDEINKGTVEDFNALNELLRSPMARYLQFAISFNPVREKHWLRKTFFDEHDRHKLHPDYQGLAYLNRSTLYDNEFIDQEEYYQTLIKSASGDPNAVRVNIEGDWGLEENNNPWLFAFDPAKHTKPLKFIPSFPVYLSFDFNRDPVTCTASQMSPSKGMPDSFLHVINEFHGMMTLKELCERIKATYPASILYVTGDRTGKNGNVGYEDKHANMYTMIQRYLRIAPALMHIEGKNMKHGDSRNLCNTVLYNHPNVFICSVNCPKLIEDCQIATVDDTKADAGVLKKDRDIYKMDMFDNFRYLIQTYFNDYANKVYLINKK